MNCLVEVSGLPVGWIKSFNNFGTDFWVNLHYLWGVKLANYKLILKFMIITRRLLMKLTANQESLPFARTSNDFPLPTFIL